jgi:hypothetical protein
MYNAIKQAFKIDEVQNQIKLQITVHIYFFRREVSCIDMEMYCTSKYSSYLYLRKNVNV